MQNNIICDTQLNFQTTPLIVFTRFTIYRSPENTSANEMEGRSHHMGFHETDEDEDGDLSPPRKFSARDDCEVITIGRKFIWNCTWSYVLFNFFNQFYFLHHQYYTILHILSITYVIIHIVVHYLFIHIFISTIILFYYNSELVQKSHHVAY